MTEPTGRELQRMIESLEKQTANLETQIVRLEGIAASREVLDSFKYQLGQKATRDQLEAVKEDVERLQESNTWLFRAIIGTMITAVTGSIISAIVGIIIRLPPM